MSDHLTIISQFLHPRWQMRNLSIFIFQENLAFVKNRKRMSFVSCSSTWLKSWTNLISLILGSSKCWLPVCFKLIVLLNRFPGGAYDRRPADFKGFSSTRIISETTLPLIQPTLTRATRNYHFPFLIFSFDHLCLIFSIIWDAFDIVMISWLLK